MQGGRKRIFSEAITEKTSDAVKAWRHMASNGGIEAGTLKHILHKSDNTPKLSLCLIVSDMHSHQIHFLHSLTYSCALLRLYKDSCLYYYGAMFDCKLICTDIDGTLLDTNHRISAKNKRVVAKAYKQGITIALVSGRKASSLEILQKELGIGGPLGCYSGALVVDGGKVLASHPISWEDARRVLSFVEGRGVDSFIYTDRRWYVQKSNPWMAFETAISKTEGKVLPFDELPEHCANNNEQPYKILCMNEDPLVVQNMEILLREKFSSSLNIYLSGPRYLEISAKDVDKGHALEAICKAYGYETSQAMAIGDYFNDLGMLKIAGYSVAMDNAPDEIKRHAHKVTASNSEDGLAKAIEAIL